MGRQTKRWGEMMMDKRHSEEEKEKEDAEDELARQSEKLRRG